MKISSLNCRSLNKHYKDILFDENLFKSEIRALEKTWLEDDTVWIWKFLDLPFISIAPEEGRE